MTDTIKYKIKKVLRFFHSKERKRRDAHFKFYDQLNEPERSRAKANYGTLNIIQMEPKVLTEALLLGFLWAESPEGKEYWTSMYYQLKDKKYIFNKK